MSKSRKKKRAPKWVLAFPDLEQSKAAVLNSLTSGSGQRTYDRGFRRKQVLHRGFAVLGPLRNPGPNVVFA